MSEEKPQLTPHEAAEASGMSPQPEKPKEEPTEGSGITIIPLILLSAVLLTSCAEGRFNLDDKYWRISLGLTGKIRPDIWVPLDPEVEARHPYTTIKDGLPNDAEIQRYARDHSSSNNVLGR